MKIFIKNGVDCIKGFINFTMKRIRFWYFNRNDKRIIRFWGFRKKVWLQDFSLIKELQGIILFEWELELLVWVYEGIRVSWEFILLEFTMKEFERVKQFERQ